MTALLHLAVFLLAFAAMEGVAWAVHRYVMHGWGWGWHRSHHEPRRGWFEANDLYAIAFAALATALFFVGAQPGLRWVWFAGLGMTAYGVAYALAHDGLVHQRFFRFTPKRGYLKRLVQAHRLHHATHGRHGGVSFGFLWAPDPRKLKARLRELEAARAAG